MDGAIADVTIFILAGGKSTRMGADKAFVTLGGRTLLERALETARSVTDDVRIVGEKTKFGEFAPVVEDVFRGCGPLAGIHAARRASGSEWNVMLAVDLPFVTKDLLQYLLGQARSSAAMVTVAHSAEGWQPLCAVYRREFAEVAEESLRAGRYKIDVLFEECRVHVIEEKELRAAGFAPGVFRNLNTAAELEAADGGSTGG
jgi:molybdopterin-guanine dinucleotide biosynthesis protein A